MIIFTYIKRFILAALTQVVFLPLLFVGYIFVMVLYLFREIKLIPFLHVVFVVVVKFTWIDLKVYMATGKYGSSLKELQTVLENFRDKL